MNNYEDITIVTTNKSQSSSVNQESIYEQLRSKFVVQLTTLIAVVMQFTIYIYAVGNDVKIFKVIETYQFARAITFASKERLIVAHLNELVLWDIVLERALNRVKLPRLMCIKSMTVDGKFVVFHYESGLGVWNMETNKLQLITQFDSIQDYCVKNSLLVVSFNGGSITVLNLVNLETVTEMEFPEDWYSVDMLNACTLLIGIKRTIMYQSLHNKRNSPALSVLESTKAKIHNVRQINQDLVAVLYSLNPTMSQLAIYDNKQEELCHVYNFPSGMLQYKPIVLKDNWMVFHYANGIEIYDTVELDTVHEIYGNFDKGVALAII